MMVSKGWSPEEDQALLTLYHDRNFRKWTQISHLLLKQYGIKGKTPKKCRERFKNHLDPSINKQEWSASEEQKLMNLQGQLGNKWAQISRFIPGRTDDAIKNKFFSKYRKAVRNINMLKCRHKNSKAKQLKISFVYKLINFIDKARKKITHATDQLLKLAEILKKTIIQFETIDNDKQKVDIEGLSRLELQVHQFSAQLKASSGRRRGRKASNPIKNSNVIQQSPKLKTDQPQMLSQFVDGTPKKLQKSVDFNIGASRMHIFSPLPLNSRFDDDQLQKQGEYQKMLMRGQQNSDEELDAWRLPVYGLSYQHQYLD